MPDGGAATPHRGAASGPREALGGVGATGRGLEPRLPPRPTKVLVRANGRETEVDACPQLRARRPSLARSLVAPAAMTDPTVVLPLRRAAPLPLPALPRQAALDAVVAGAAPLATR